MYSVKFPAFKFCAFDYVYENTTRQQLATSWMYIPFPKGLQQNEHYCHSRIFANDNYRRPWTRSSVIPTCKVYLEGSVLDELKKYSCFEEHLEKLQQKVTDVIPSSNPGSQVDLEELFLLTENVTTDEDQSLEECWKTSVTNGKEGIFQDYLLPDEVVFVDNLVKFGQNLPSLQVLLRRLKTFSVPDPLVELKNVLSTDQYLFRINITNAEQTEPCRFEENFHVQPPNTVEGLMLPCILVNEDARKRTNRLLELCEMLELAPEIVICDGQTVNEDFSTKETEKTEAFQQSTSEKDIYPDRYDSISDTACYMSYHYTELETPFTPPCLPFKYQTEELHVELNAEEMSPDPHNILITKSSLDSLESLVYDSETYPLLLKVPHIDNTLQCMTISELTEKISVYPESPVCIISENKWWTELGLSGLSLSSHSIEPLNIDKHSSIDQSSKIELFLKITESHLEYVMEEKAVFMKQKTCLQNSQLQSINCASPKIKLLKTNILEENQVSSIVTHSEVENSEFALCTKKDTIDAYTSYLNQGLKNNAQLPTCELALSNGNDVSTKPKETCFSSNSKAADFYEPEIQSKTKSDLLNNFIMLRTKQMPSQLETQVIVETTVHDAENLLSRISDLNTGNPSSTDVITELGLQEDTNCHLLSVDIPASESQCQAYLIIEASANPTLNKLKALGVHSCNEWTFDSLSFDSTRFFLRQQEKKITGNCKIEKKEDQKILFKHAAILHILVTLRDLILMCTFDTALEYLCKAKEIYKSALGSSLDDVWKKFEIVKFVKENKQEVNPKITALQVHLLQFIKNNCKEEKLIKVLIILRTESDDTKNSIIDAFDQIPGMKAIGLCPENGRLLEKESLLESLKTSTCIIIYNRYITNDFPWTEFSLVVEYDCTDCWLNLCQDLKIDHMILKTWLPEHISLGRPSAESIGDIISNMKIPYVFLSTEGLLNNSEIMEHMESRHITFIERSSSSSLQLFGNTEQFAVITVDECTAVIMQNLEELKYEKSSENIILKLVALSLQYSCCWVILYSTERINSDYSLSGNILHHLSLLYAALIPFTSKSEELEVKVLISPGVEETGLFIRQIAYRTVIASNRDPYDWLERSWLSVLSSEAEQCILSFPCINPMVAQLMLQRGSSLQWLLSATIEQLQDLLPEVPRKVIKHFSDITSLYRLSSYVSPPHSSDMSPSTRMTNTFTSFNEHVPMQISLPVIKRPDYHNCNPFYSEKIQCKTADVPFINTPEAVVSNKPIKPLLSYNGDNVQSKAQYQTQAICDYPEGSISFGQTLQSVPLSLYNPGILREPAVPSNKFGISTETMSLDFLKQKTQSKNIFDQCMQSSKYQVEFADACNPDACYQPLEIFHSKGQATMSTSKRDGVFTEFLSNQVHNSPVYYPNEIEDVVNPTPTADKQCDLYNVQHGQDSFCSETSQNLIAGINFQHMAVDPIGMKHFIAIEKDIKVKETSRGMHQLSRTKRRRLSYEKVPGRCDGQTRLKFF